MNHKPRGTQTQVFPQCSRDNVADLAPRNIQRLHCHRKNCTGQSKALRWLDNARPCWLTSANKLNVMNTQDRKRTYCRKIPNSEAPYGVSLSDWCTFRCIYDPSPRVSYRESEKTEARRRHTSSWITHSPDAGTWGLALTRSKKLKEAAQKSSWRFMAVCKLIFELMTWNKEQQQGKISSCGWEACEQSPWAI